MNKILIAEDEKMIRRGLRTIIERSQVPVDEVIEASNGMIAWEILQREAIDLVFTDIKMPKMDGIQLVKQIRTLDRKPFVVAISGYDDFNYAVSMLRNGVREYLLKPIERDKIKELLEKFEDEQVQHETEEKERKHTGYQQLKIMLKTGNLSKEEKAWLNKQTIGKWLFDDYRFICFPKSYIPMVTTRVKISDEEQGILINDVEAYNIYIVKEKDLENRIHQYFEESYVGISQVHQGLESVKEAYKEASEARQEAFGRLHHLYYYAQSNENKAIHVNPVYMFNQEMMFKLVQMLGTEHIAHIEKIMNSMKEETIKARLDMTEFQNNMIYLLNEISRIYNNVLQIDTTTLSCFDQMLDYPCINDYMEVVISWMREINGRITQEFDDYKNKQKIKDALTYIQKNYDYDLNMAVVSNQVSMNYSLFSHLFKEYTGENFVNYLKELRVQEARKLLETTEFRIHEISRKVGYENEKYFMKVFKRMYGVSPGEYRKNMQHESL